MIHKIKVYSKYVLARDALIFGFCSFILGFFCFPFLKSVFFTPGVFAAGGATGSSTPAIITPIGSLEDIAVRVVENSTKFSPIAVQDTVSLLITRIDQKDALISKYAKLYDTCKSK